jgi:hypothetical protein
MIDDQNTEIVYINELDTQVIDINQEASQDTQELRTVSSTPIAVPLDEFFDEFSRKVWDLAIECTNLAWSMKRAGNNMAFQRVEGIAEKLREEVLGRSKREIDREAITKDLGGKK